MVKLITNGVASGLGFGFDNYDYKDVSNRSSEVKKYFKNKDNDFQSFLDLLKIAEAYRKPVQASAAKPATKPATKPAAKDQKYVEL